jgi:hypothetical protein
MDSTVDGLNLAPGDVQGQDQGNGNLDLASVANGIDQATSAINAAGSLARSAQYQYNSVVNTPQANYLPAAPAVPRAAGAGFLSTMTTAEKLMLVLAVGALVMGAVHLGRG